MYKLEFAMGWDRNINSMDKNEATRIMKKIEQLMMLEHSRHLGHGLNYFVTEVGQYRICYEQKGNTRIIAFAGNHKQYEKWYKKQ